MKAAVKLVRVNGKLEVLGRNAAVRLLLLKTLDEQRDAALREELRQQDRIRLAQVEAERNFCWGWWKS